MSKTDLMAPHRQDRRLFIPAERILLNVKASFLIELHNEEGTLFTRDDLAYVFAENIEDWLAAAETNGLAEVLDSFEVEDFAALGTDWTPDFQSLAQQEGWDVFEGDQSFAVEAISAPGDHPHLGYTEPKFESDVEALAYVKQLAKAGSALHQTALRFVAEHNEERE